MDDYEKFIKGQKVVTCILTIVNSNMFSSSRQNPSSHWLVLKPLLEFIPWHFINSTIPIYSILLDGQRGTVKVSGVLPNYNYVLLNLDLST